MKNKNYTCPACGYKTFIEPPGSYDICDICGWEDDASQLKYVLSSGANKQSLFDSQQLFSKKKVESATKNVKDKNWRMLDKNLDKDILVHESNVPNSYPDDLTELYYWSRK